MTEVFSKIQLRFKNGTLSTQHVHVRNSKGLRNLQKSTTGPLRSIAISTGMCLFSRALVPSFGSPDDNSSDECRMPLPCAQTDLTIYELETMIRLASTIADVVGILKHHAETERLSIVVNVDIPDVQYYWPAIELFRKGTISEAHLKSWFATVDERRCKLRCFFEAAINELLESRLLPAIRIVLAQGTESVRRYYKRVTALTAIPSLEDLLDILKGDEQTSNTWSTFLKSAGSKFGPTNIQDLGYIMHVFNALSPVFWNKHRTIHGESEPDLENHKPQLLLQIDDIIEWKVFARAQNVLKAYQASLHGE